MDCMIKKICIGAAVMLFVSGCASSVAKEQTAATLTSSTASAVNSDTTAKVDKYKKICSQEKTIGSNRKSVRCTTHAERERVREVSREAWLRTQQGSVKTGN